MKKLIVLAIIMLFAWCVFLLWAGSSFEPIFVIDRDKMKQESAMMSGTTIPALWIHSVPTKCQEEVWEYGKAPYIRDCD